MGSGSRIIFQASSCQPGRGLTGTRLEARRNLQPCPPVLQSTQRPRFRYLWRGCSLSQHVSRVSLPAQLQTIASSTLSLKPSRSTAFSVDDHPPYRSGRLRRGRLQLHERMALTRWQGLSTEQCSNPSGPRSAEAVSQYRWSWPGTEGGKPKATRLWRRPLI